MMIVVDIETSGVQFDKNGIWQIRAIDLDDPKNFFFEESRIDEEDLVLDSGEYAQKSLFEIIGKTEDELRDKNKQSQKQMLENFFNWASNCKVNNLICQNPQFDLSFILTKARKYGIKPFFHYRALDLHSIAQIKYFEINRGFVINEEKNRLEMNLTKILEFCGLNYQRGKHNALEDSKLTAECFYRLVYGKNLLEEFQQFGIPSSLIKQKTNENDNV